MMQARIEAFREFTEATNPWVTKVLKYWPDSDKTEIARAILETAERHETFTADLVRDEHCFLQGMRPNLISAMFSALHKKRMIVATGEYVSSSRPARHGSVHMVWRINLEMIE